jgi:RNA polymerase sigma-54 factor
MRNAWPFGPAGSRELSNALVFKAVIFMGETAPDLQRRRRMSHLAQTQTATLTQHLSHEMTQKLAVLQTSTLELATLVRQQLELNPVLEVEENTLSEVSLEEAGLEEHDDDEQLRQLVQLDSDWRSGAPSTSRGAGDAEFHQRTLDSLTKPTTLTEHIARQVNAMRLDAEERGDVMRLLGHLNDNGWLTQPLTEIAATENRPLEDMEFARDVLLSLEPAGLGATGLRECLMVQLEREGKNKTLEYHLLKDCFDALAKRRFEDMAATLDVEVEDVVEAAERLTLLHPRPARLFDAEAETGHSVEPELTFEEVDGAWTVTVHREFTPGLRISASCKNLLNAGGGAEVRAYLREHIRKGRWFITCLAQRQETIRKVAQEIVSRQEDFFVHGPAHLRPMKMADIAQAIGVHETTISRTVNGKYARTPHGVFELRTFFTSGMSTDSGTDVSSRAVEAALREIVQNEDATQPLSDMELATRLAERGIRIARRTVLKYRDRLRILPAPLRRRGLSNLHGVSCGSP